MDACGHSRLLWVIVAIAALVACPTALAVPPSGPWADSAGRQPAAPLASPSATTASSFTAVAPPANDEIAAAEPIPALPYAQALSTVEATTAIDDPTCAGVNAASVWYAYTAPIGTWVTASTAGSDYDTTLSVYTGTPGALVEVACNDDADDETSRADFLASGGVTYYVMVAGKTGGGDLQLDVDVRPPLPLVGVRTTGAIEVHPAAGPGHFAWTRAPRRSARHWSLLVKPTAKKQVRVNRARTTGFAGGIDGKWLIYQEINRNRSQSNLYLYNLTTRKRSAPAGVNTRKWEWGSTISGTRILFGRDDNRTSLVILRDQKTRKSLVLDRITRRANKDLWPGQLKGNYATWFRCTPKCDVFVYDIAAKSKTRLPNPLGRQQYSPAVTADGTVYFVSSGRGCGNTVRLERKSPGRPSVTLASLPAQRDVGRSYALQHADGTTSVFFDRINCKTGAADILKIVDP